ncbi:hypothetical protein Tco_0232844 [Tanacetum coccineum]
MEPHRSVWRAYPGSPRPGKRTSNRELAAPPSLRDSRCLVQLMPSCLSLLAALKTPYSVFWELPRCLRVPPDRGSGLTGFSLGSRFQALSEAPKRRNLGAFELGK